MTPREKHPVGRTRGTGFQVGARRTFPVTSEAAWRLLTSPGGIRLWLDDAAAFSLEKGATYRLANGTHGEVRVVTSGSHLRLTWHPAGWPRPSTIQLRVIPKDDRTVIAFHQEHLPGAEERDARREHFRAVLDELVRILGAG